MNIKKIRMNGLKNNRGVLGTSFDFTIVVMLVIVIVVFVGTTSFTVGVFKSMPGEQPLSNPEEPGGTATCPTNYIVCGAKNNQLIKDVSLDSVYCCDYEEEGAKVDKNAVYFTGDDMDAVGDTSNKNEVPSLENGDIFCGSGEVICGVRNIDRDTYKAEDILSDIGCCPAKGIHVNRNDAYAVTLKLNSFDPGEKAVCEVDEVVCAMKHDSDDADILDYIWCCKYETFEIKESGTVYWSQSDQYHFSMGGYLFEDGTEGEVLFDSKEGNYNYINETGGAKIARRPEDNPYCPDVSDNLYSASQSYAVLSGDRICVKTKTGEYILMEYLSTSPNSKFEWEFQD